MGAVYQIPVQSSRQELRFGGVSQILVLDRHWPNSSVLVLASDLIRHRPVDLRHYRGNDMSEASEAAQGSLSAREQDPRNHQGYDLQDAEGTKEVSSTTSRPCAIMIRKEDAMRTIAVDFDGVIHTYEQGWLDGSIYGEFMPGAIDGLLRLMNDYAVFVHTTRPPLKVGSWIEQKSAHSIECVIRPPWKRFWNEKGVLLVTRRKLPAFAYIDDRGLRFRNWPQAHSSLDAMIGLDEKGQW
jgi:hypothetical protein